MKQVRNIKQEIIFVMFAIFYGMLAWNVCVSFIRGSMNDGKYTYFLAILAPFCSIVYLLCTGQEEWTLRAILLQNLRFILRLLPGALILSAVHMVVDPRMILVRNLLINYIWIFVMCLFYGAMFYAIYQAMGRRTEYPAAVLLAYALNSVSPWLPVLKNVGYKLYIYGEPEENEFLIMLPYLIAIAVIYGVAAVLQYRKKKRIV